MPSSYASLSRAQLAVLVPELLLIGHLIDRTGMAYAISEFGPEAMAQIAIEEWAGASPIYARRMQQALEFEGDDVVTIFKALQLDIGAPPQFLDFRFELTDRLHGEFYLDHCGALLDVEPMGESFVRAMCHDIEDGTFDATAMATNPRARIRPVHRPPRTPTDRHPHCRWSVDIEAEPGSPPLPPTPALETLGRTRAATLVLDPIDTTDEGLSHYRGDLLADLDFGGFSHSALVRIADEVVLQMHLLALSFREAVAARADGADQRHRVLQGQLIGHAGLAAQRLVAALGLGSEPADAARLMELHPMFNPAAYVTVHRDGSTISVEPSAAHDDGAWPAWCGPDRPEALQAIVRAVDPHLDVDVRPSAQGWSATVVRNDQPAPLAPAVALANLSLGARFEFEQRRSLPLTVI